MKLDEKVNAVIEVVLEILCLAAMAVFGGLIIVAFFMEG